MRKFHKPERKKEKGDEPISLPIEIQVPHCCEACQGNGACDVSKKTRSKHGQLCNIWKMLTELSQQRENHFCDETCPESPLCRTNFSDRKMILVIVANESSN